jgi:hypothetical protein
MEARMRPNAQTRPAWILSLALAGLLLVPAAAQAADIDCDGVEDAVDNCPDRFNPTQADSDGDLEGDRCDSDKDGDSVENDLDNCPRASNVAQDDSDGDTVGDACDQCGDATLAAVNKRGCSIEQLCPCDGPDDEDRQWKSHDQYFRCIKKKARDFRRKEIITSDERGEILDAARFNNCGNPVPAEGDNDGDGVADASDNCPSDSNPSQRNTDADEFGDACDADKDDDLVLNENDNCPLVQNASGQTDDADEDGVGDACDVCAGTAADAVVDNDGCGLDQHCPCDLDADGNPWASHGKYYRCYGDEVFRFRILRLVSKEDADLLKMAARANDCGDRPPICE